MLLAVPDDEIARASEAIRPGPMVGHCAGSLGLEVLAPHEAFGLHPLMTVTREEASLHRRGRSHRRHDTSGPGRGSSIR